MSKPTVQPHKGTPTVAPAVVGDVVVMFHGDRSGIQLMEQVTDEWDAEMITERWHDQALAIGPIEVWELRPGGWYKRRNSNGPKWSDKAQ